jgi:xanthine dehydrogenase small subunit
MNLTASNSVKITINQQSHVLQSSTLGHNETLLKTLHKLGLQGTKEGCGDGDCGACTVAWCAPQNGDCTVPARYLAINSCLVPTAQLAGSRVLTVEGIAQLSTEPATLHPVQQAMIDCAGSQCGYCTPGFVMSLFCDYHANSLSDLSVEGNLCRCTGYTSIRQAIEKLKLQQPNPIPRHPRAGGDPGKVSILNQTDSEASANSLFLPTSLSEALTLKQTNPDALWLAGGTDLGLAFSQCGGATRHIALDQIPELQRLELTEHALHIGSAVPLAGLLALLESHSSFEPITRMLHWFAARQVRNRATMGGNLGTASPIGDLLPVLLALDAQIVLAGPTGERTVIAADYFLSYRKTECKPDELVLRVDIAKPKPGRISQSYKVGKRGSDDISIVSSCFQLGIDATGQVDFARLAYGGVAAVPIRAIAAENALIGVRSSDDLLDIVKPILLSTLQPLSDFRGSAAYRQQLIVNLFDKFLREQQANLHGEVHG